MTTKSSAAYAALAVILNVSVFVYPTSGQQLPLWQLESSIDTVRVLAFYQTYARANGIELRTNADELLRGGPMARLSLRPQRLAAKAAESPELREALIALLQRENVIVDNPGPASLSEAEMIEFRLDVVSVVASMKVAGTIAALSPWVSVGGRAAVALEQFGEAAVPHLVPLIQHRDQFRRAGAARVLGRIAARNMELRVSAPAMEAIKQALLLATKHQEDFILRLIGVRGLSSFSGEDVRTAMERIASEDRTSVVREAAEKWLRDHPRTQ